jgi:hypothetical protein
LKEEEEEQEEKGKGIDAAIMVSLSFSPHFIIM